MPKRIIMWSPPRARSTLMMRVFEALGCAVFDEPFYACWLQALDKRDDPGFTATLAAHPTQWTQVIDQILGPVPDQNNWFYQKHMAIHMLPDAPLDWMSHPDLIHCFLIRDPTEVIVSMAEFRDLAALARAGEIEEAARLVGIPQLQYIFERVRSLTETTPPIIDANDVLRDPSGTLGAFCHRIGLPFDPGAPIEWQSGQHPADGAWAPLWYQKVFATTGLRSYAPGDVEVPDALQAVVDVCSPVYDTLHRLRITS